MKKITFLSLCFLSLLFLSSNNNAAQNKDSLSSPNNPSLNKPVVKDYKKASDSLLSIAEQNNNEAYKKLEEFKKLQNLKEQQNKELSTVRKEIQNNLRLTINLYKQKLQEQNKKTTKKSTNKDNELIVGNDVIKLDSIHKKGNLFKKSRWIYTITFPDGTIKTLD